MTIQHLRSSTANKRPTPAAMSDGQIAVNTNTASPGLFFKDSAGALIKVGPVHVGTTAPNASPAGGGETGNTVGEQWLDTTGGTYVFKVWDGSAWRSESGTFVDVNGDVMTGALGIIAGSAGSPGLYFSGDTNTGLYSPGADQVAISTNGTKRIEIQADGDIDIDNGGVFYDATNNRLAIGSTSPSHLLDVNGDVAVGIGAANGNNYNFRVRAGTTGLSRFIAADTSDAGYIDYDHNLNNWIFRTNSSEAFRVDSSQRLLVGTSTSTNNSRLGQKLAVVSSGGTANDYGGISLTTYAGSSDSFSAPVLDFQRSRGTADGSFAEVVSGDALGYIAFRGADGAGWSDAASIKCEADGDWTTSGDATDSPGRLVFSTTADGASSPTERMRVTSGGIVAVGVTSPTFSLSDNTGVQISSGRVLASADGSASLFVNRKTNDGDLVVFAQADIQEGSISVSGTTVSYNGAHLSRWSQLPSGADRIEILRGSVLSNIDEMCEWGEEDNEQLNRMKVSDVEGDKNVSGVFQAWDDDDDTYTNDFYCAMTGDFIIRIGAGVTVERGDLLMSAGDGTAKPQDDDIIRSKTIAKVTSTNVSCTYDDGSYCVPCVLMAC